MHRIESRTYVGQPREKVTVTTEVRGGGQVRVSVNGVDMGPQAEFPLPSDPGDRIKWQIDLRGPRGATCVVSTVQVDGGSDPDFLICQVHNPAPVHFYTCSVVQAPVMKALRKPRGARRKTAVKKSTRKAVKRTAKKKTAKKGGRR